MTTKLIPEESVYPDNRLAIVVSQEEEPVGLLYLSARFGVFVFERGQWQSLRNSEKVLERFSGMTYFHADLFESTKLAQPGPKGVEDRVAFEKKRSALPITLPLIGTLKAC